jgi:uncharacterized protein YgbK (DUF1537 family)
VVIVIIGVVADDITGANDIGIMFAKWGYLTQVYHHAYFEQLYRPEVEVCIIDTNSRLDSPELAYEKVFTATKALERLGCKQYHNKTCSVFRGNIGAEFDAMLDALQEEFAIVVLGFPKNGRTTIENIHYVRGTKLEDSEFKNDPVHPMRQSNLVDILQSQTKRRVGAIHQDTIEAGNLRQSLEQMRQEYQYLILDVTEQSMLKTIASTIHDYPVLCGSSAIAEELPAFWQRKPSHQPIPMPAPQNLGILCAAGSLMPQTAAQIEAMRQKNVPVLEFNPLELFDKRKDLIERVTAEIINHLQTSDVVFHAANQSSIVEQMRTEGLSRGLSVSDVSRMVSSAVAEIVALCVERTGLNRLLIAGGETSAAVCEGLGIYGMSIWKEIQAGLPICISLTEKPLALVLKSGSFGSSDFFEQAINHLKQM